MSSIRCRNFFHVVFLLVFVTHGFSQDRSIDSVAVANDTIRISPDGRSVSINSLGYYAFSTEDRIARQTYGGASVFNTLRGHVPNLSIGDNVFGVSPGLRNGNSMVVVDGVPFSSAINSFYNFNTFDFKTISAVSSANGLVMYGTPGSNGAIILETKSGKDILKPQLEFNSFTTFARYDEIDGLIDDELDQWIFVNSVAYAQDFGKVDTRISYSNILVPDDSGDSKNSYGRNAVRLNTGIEFGPRFTARLTADANINKFQEEKEDIPTEEEETSSLSANLFLKFNAARWFSICSQSAFSNIVYNNMHTFDNDQLDHENDTQARRYTNLFLEFTPGSGAVWKWNLSIGGQINAQELSAHAISDYGNYSSEGTIQSWSLVPKISVGFKNYIHVELISRDENYSDHFNVPIVEMGSQSSASANVAFIFSEAFGLKNDWFQLGKLRGSFGQNDYGDPTGFPYWEFLQVGYSPYVETILGEPFLQASEKRSQEIGFDLAFAQSRIMLSSTFFSDSYFGSSLAFDEFEDNNVELGTASSKGSEFVVTGVPVQNSNSRILTKLIYSTFKSESSISSTEVDMLYHTGINPMWTGSFLVEATTKRFFASALIAHNKNEEDLLYSHYGALIAKYDLSGTWLRDLSVGWNVSKFSISLSGRNLIRFDHKKENNELGELMNRIQKTVSLSVSGKF